MPAPRVASRRTRLALAPIVGTLGGWDAAALAHAVLGCQGPPPDLAPCPLLGVDLGPLIEGGLFWCLLLAGPAGLCSFALLLWLPARRSAARVSGAVSRGAETGAASRVVAVQVATPITQGC